MVRITIAESAVSLRRGSSRGSPGTPAGRQSHVTQYSLTSYANRDIVNITKEERSALPMHRLAPKLSLVVAALAILASTSSARASMVQRADLDSASQASATGPIAGDVRALVVVSRPLGATSAAAPAETVGEPTHSLPPPPSSVALVLSAIGSAGAYQAARSLRKLHFGVVPDWYHDGAVQVGHRTPLSLEFSLNALPACVFEAPLVAELAGSWRVPRDCVPRPRLALFLPTEAPRGPPF